MSLCNHEFNTHVDFHSRAIFAFCYLSYYPETEQCYNKICDSILKLKASTDSVLIKPVAINRMRERYLDNTIAGKNAIEYNGQINTLPDELLLRIFKYVGYTNIANMSKTCTHWAKLCKDKSLWNYFKDISTKSTEIILEFLNFADDNVHKQSIIPEDAILQKISQTQYLKNKVEIIFPHDKGNSFDTIELQNKLKVLTNHIMTTTETTHFFCHGCGRG